MESHKNSFHTVLGTIIPKNRQKQQRRQLLLGGLFLQHSWQRTLIKAPCGWNTRTSFAHNVKLIYSIYLDYLENSFNSSKSLGRDRNSFPVSSGGTYVGIQTFTIEQLMNFIKTRLFRPKASALCWRLGAIYQMGLQW